jgi:cob(I)alamin adenosyltransferase
VKIYTRTGDDGTTGLFGGARVKKSDARVSAYGSVDEANAAIAMATESAGAPLAIKAQLSHVMNDLFDVGAELATPDDADAKLRARMRLIGDDRVKELEMAIDAAEAELLPLTTFILPGGSAVAAQLHFARAVVRRAEREVVELPGVRPEVVRYLNRLSDALFVWARLANHLLGAKEVAWQKR